MTDQTWPEGLLTALVTPLTDDQVDGRILGELVDRQVRSGVGGLVVGGGTGEFGALTLDERKAIATETISATARRVPVIVQTGALSTRDAITLSQHAENAGADAIMVASPFGEPINWTERFHFYETLDRAVALPIVVYNTPPSGLLTLDHIKLLADLNHVRAVKDSSGSPELMGDLVEFAGGTDFGVYVGMDSLLYDAVRGGARGAIFGAANVIPGPLRAVASSLRADGPNAANTALWREIRPFLRFMEGSPNYVALCKAGLALQGLKVGPVRAPYLMPDGAEITELAARLERVVHAFEASTLAAA